MAAKLKPFSELAMVRQKGVPQGAVDDPGRTRHVPLFERAFETTRLRADEVQERLAHRCLAWLSRSIEGKLCDYVVAARGIRVAFGKIHLSP